MAEIECIKTTIRETADALSGRLFMLQEIAHLAAFAVEARRTLEGIEDALACRPEFDKILSQQIEAHRNWTAMKDSTGNVMQWVARQMAGVDEDVTAAFYAIADGREAAHG